MQASDRFELEEIGRQAVKMLYDGLNSAIDTQQALMAARDATYWPSIGQVDPGFTVEHVPAGNFYVGNVPSLIEAAVEKYPNCAAYCYRAASLGSNDDDGEIFAITLAVELMCKSLKSETEANARISRTVEAAHSVLAQNTNRGFGGYAWGLEDNAPGVSLGDVFVRRHDKARNDRWFWQGGRLEYSVSRYVGYTS